MFCLKKIINAVGFGFRISFIVTIIKTNDDYARMMSTLSCC